MAVYLSKKIDSFGGIAVHNSCFGESTQLYRGWRWRHFAALHLMQQHLLHLVRHIRLHNKGVTAARSLVVFVRSRGIRALEEFSGDDGAQPFSSGD